MIFSFKKNRGEVSLVFVFIVLSVIIVTATTISLVAVAGLKGVNAGNYAAYAQVAVDSYLEKALLEYNWTPPGNTTPTCLNGILPDVDGQGTDVTIMTDNGIKDGETGSACPSIADVNAKNASLCIYVFAENHGVKKKYLSGAGANICPVR